MMLVIPLNALAAKRNTIPNNEIGIPDKLLYQKILQELDKDKDDTFTEKEAARITRLDAQGNDDDIEFTKIKSLKGIGKLKNLTYLNVSFNRLTSIADLKNLEKLKNVNVADNKLGSLYGIEHSKRLNSLVASRNQLKNLSGIESLFNLASLDVSYNQLTSIKEVKKLVRLETLVIDTNKITSIKEVERLKKLKYLYAGQNKIKSIPDLNKYTNLLDVEFKYNRISEKELKKKLLPRFKRATTWFKSTVKFQSIVRTIKLKQPTSFDAIDKKTKQITGKANKKATIVLRDPSRKRIQVVKSDNQGIFTLKNLNLKKWTGKTLTLESFIVDQVYGERDTLKVVKFIVRK